MKLVMYVFPKENFIQYSLLSEYLLVPIYDFGLLVILIESLFVQVACMVPEGVTQIPSFVFI